MARRHGDGEASDGASDLGADPEQGEAQRAAGGLGELGMGQSEAAQCAEQDIGHGGEPRAQLVGAHGCRRGAAGEEVELALLDAGQRSALAHVAAGAVEALVEGAGTGLGALERGDDG